MVISLPDRSGERTRQPPREDEKSCNTWSLKPWWGKQILHLFTRQDRNFSRTSGCCLSRRNKCLQLKVNDALRQGCRHHTVDRVKQRSAAVGHIDSLIYCVVSCQFAWVRNNNSAPRCREPGMEKETFALINLKELVCSPPSLFIPQFLLASILL